MNFLSNFLVLGPKSKIHFRQLLHSTQDFEILHHGSKYLPLDEKWWDFKKISVCLDNGISTLYMFYQTASFSGPCYTASIIKVKRRPRQQPLHQKQL